MNSWITPPRQNLVSVKPTREPIWRDVNNTYGQELGSLLVDNDIAVRKRMLNLLSTPLGTDHLEPTYGSLLPWRLYEPINVFTEYLLETDTVEALARWMSREVVLIIPGVQISALDSEDGYNIVIPYMRFTDSGASAYSFDIIR